MAQQHPDEQSDDAPPRDDLAVPDLLNTAEACAYLHVGKDTLKKFRDEDLPYIDYGYSFRYDRAELDAYMRARRRNNWTVS